MLEFLLCYTTDMIRSEDLPGEKAVNLGQIPEHSPEPYLRSRYQMERMCLAFLLYRSNA
jgi:hypothetical protein